MSRQQSLEIAVRREQVAIDRGRDALAKIKTLGHAMAKCADAAGVPDKNAICDIASHGEAAEVDGSTWSRIKGGTATPNWATQKAAMQAFGNELPLFWMLHDLGYDPSSLRRYETDLERENRTLREQLAEERKRNDHVAEFFAKARAA